MSEYFLSVSAAKDFIANNLIAVGVPKSDAVIVANLMIQSDLAGADGHGIFRLPAYVKRIRAGGINLHPNIRYEREQGAITLINGDNALWHLVIGWEVITVITQAQLLSMSEKLPRQGI